MCRHKKPKKILEIGTAIGYSAILMQKSSGIDTQVFTLERDEKMFEIAKKNISDMALNSKINIILGDAKDTLLNIKNKFDLVFLDAAKGQYQEFFDNCLDLLNKDGLIICDNVLFRGMIANDDLVSKKYLKSFLYFLWMSVEQNFMRHVVFGIR
jgi:predicted O-methyltransferase YrrM